MQVKVRVRWTKAMSLASVAALLTVALFSWGQLGRTPQNLQSRGRLPSRQQLQNLEIVSKLSAEHIETLTMRGQYVYASGMGTLIAVYDISDPQNIRKVGELPFNLPEGQYGHVEKLEVVGNYAYAQTIVESGMDYTVSLKIIDISNPANPRQVSEYAPTGVKVIGFVLGNNYAYVQVSGSKLHVLNISNPANPQFVREISDVPDLEGDGGVVAGNKLYLVHGLNGVSIWNIEQPDNPQKLGTVDTPGVARSVAVSGNYAYVADGRSSTSGAEQGYLRVIIDVSDPSNPEIVNSIATAGNNPWFPIALVGNALYLGDLESGATQIFDITNPTSPNSVGTIQGLLAGFDASSNRIITRHFGTDFIVWDITNRTAPNRLARYSGLSPSVTALKDEYLITTTSAGLIVFNASNPAQLQKVSQIELPDLPSHWGIRLVLAGDLAIVSHSNYTAGPKIYFVNFATPINPQLLGTDDLGQTTSVFDIEVIKDRYLLVGHTSGCEIFDLTTRTRVGSVRGIYGSVLGVAGKGDVVCLVQSQRQGSILKVFDATDPLNMRFRGELPLNEEVSDIEMVGSLVFIATRKANFLVIDVSDPSSPRQVTSWINPNALQEEYRYAEARITTSGSFAYLAVRQEESGLIVLDLSELPNRITKVASFSRYCYQASVQGNLIYLATTYDRIYVLRNLLVPQVLPPSVFLVSPRIVPAASDVTLRVEGANFASGAQVWLERASQKLNPNRVTIVGSNIIYAQFNLSNATLGKWDLIVRNPDGNLARKSEVVTIVEAPDLILANLRLEPSENLQEGTPVTIKVTARNIGGMNANFSIRFLAGKIIIGEQPVTLAANSESEVSLPWRVIAGNYQLRAIADPENAVPESNETNNEITLPINLPSPDLTVTSLSISPSSNLVDGQQVEVQVTVTNRGEGTSRPITVKFLVDEGNYGEQTLYEGLGASSSKNLTFRHIVSGGQKQISIVLDPADTVPESDETNNRRDLALPEIPRPDVAITNLRTYPSTNLSPGMNIQLIATIHNFGGATVKNFAVNFSAAGSNLTGWVNGIGANESKEVEVTWRNIPAGQHQISATVDPYNALPDANRANNSATTMVEVTAPDFVVEGMEIRANRVVSGAMVTVAAFVQISGSGRTVFPIPVRLFDNDVPVGEALIEAGIPAGQRLTLRIPYQARSGQRRLKVVVDPDNRVNEPNENNNSAEQTLDVPAPDVALNVALIPDNPQTGQPFFIRGTVRNNGETTTVPFRVIAEVFDENNRVIASNYRDFFEGIASGASSDLNFGFTRLFEMKRVRVKINWQLAGFQDANPDNDEATFNLPDVALPDFELTTLDVRLPALVGMGRTITFSITVTNRGGSYRLLNYWAGIPVAIYLNDQLITTAFFGALDSNASTTVVANWVIDRPFTNPTIKVVIDPDRKFPDSDRTNNEAQTQIEATVQKLDLVPVDVQITPDGKPAGSWVYIQVRVRKEGTGDYYGPVPVRVLIDEEQLDNIYTWLSLTDSNPEGVINLWWVVKPGSERNLRVILDPANAVDEQNETNNILEKIINYSATAPDFVVESVDYEPKENVRQGDLVIFTATIRNKGGAYTGSIPVRLRLNTGFERTVYVGDLNANEMKTVKWSEWWGAWSAVPGSDHQVTVDVDPFNQIPESDEANNRLAQLLPLVVSPRPIVQFSWVSHPPSPIAPGSNFSLNWTLNNSGAQTVPVTVSVSGLPEGWVQVEPAAATLPANGQLSGTVTVSVPNNWAEEREFTMILQAQANGATARVERKFRVEIVPRISGLTPSDGARFGSTTVEFTWYTQIPSTSEVFIKRPVDVNWQRFSGESGTFHKVVVSGLRRNSTYLFYVRSASSSGEGKSEERRIFVTNAVSFEKSEYTAEVRRDYDQRLTVTVINNDRVPHTIKAELVDNPYDDAPAGLLGEGTFDEPARLSPGQRLAITFAAHFQDARQSDYTFRIRVRTLDEPTEQVDEATVKIKVRPPDVRIRVVQIAEDPLTMVKTFRVTNEGTDPATDLTIDPQGLSAEQVGMQPLIQHAYLAPRQSIEFKIFPLLLPPDFRPFTLSDIIDARFSFDTGLINWPTAKPYDVYLYINDVEVGSLQSALPMGTFVFPVAPQILLPPTTGRSVNPSWLPSGKEVVEVPQSIAQPLINRLAEGFNLKVSYANKSEIVKGQWFSGGRQSQQKGLFIVDKGPRVLQQFAQAFH